jgi:hypothetical protein
MSGKNNDHLKPGERIDRSGEYKEIGPRGGDRGEVTLVRGKTAPPGQVPGSTFVMARPARNAAGKGG